MMSISLINQFQSLALKSRTPALLKLDSLLNNIDAVAFSTHNKEAPVKPQNGFFIFLNEKRQKYKQEGVARFGSYIELVKDASTQWKSMSEVQKKPYVDKWQSDFERYKQQRKEYLESLSELDRGILLEQKRQKLKLKKLAQQKKAKRDGFKEVGFPRRPYSAYLCYSKSRMAMIRTRSVEEARKNMQSIAQEWKRMPEYRRQEFEKRASIDKQRYQRELQACVERARLQGKLHLLPEIVRKELKREEKKQQQKEMK